MKWLHANASKSAIKNDIMTVEWGKSPYEALTEIKLLISKTTPTGNQRQKRIQKHPNNGIYPIMEQNESKYKRNIYQIFLIRLLNNVHVQFGLMLYSNF